ncbi:MAG: hypothetical protein HY919_05595 [Elusimicrobia bacterium]|nr:hypothetical protein [Elusimicrobiota bacterium]
MKTRWQLFLALALGFSYALFVSITCDDNERSRLALTYSIVDFGCLNIDRYHTDIIDKAYFRVSEFQKRHRITQKKNTEKKSVKFCDILWLS